MRYLLVLILLVVGIQSHAREIAGVEVAASVTNSEGVVLHLNGAGIRKKFIFDIYIAELYLQNPGKTTKAILAGDTARRMVMHILYDEISQDKLIDGWNDGFKGNSDDQVLDQLKENIAKFNEMFGEVKKGEQIVLDYIPGVGTKVTIAGVEKGIVPGKDFSDALLLIWLGEKPVTKSLKKELLGVSE